MLSTTERSAPIIVLSFPMVVCYIHVPYDFMTHIYNNGYNNFSNC